MRLLLRMGKNNDLDALAIEPDETKIINQSRNPHRKIVKIYGKTGHTRTYINDDKPDYQSLDQFEINNIWYRYYHFDIKLDQ